MKNIRTRTDLALFAIRVVTGFVFFMHGYQKVFGMGLGAVGEAFAKNGIPMGSMMGPAIGLLELIGGIALIIGLGTRIVALLFICDMAGAFLFVHMKGGFFLPSGYEFVFVLAAMSLALVLGGAGAMSVDSTIAARKNTQP